MSLYDDVPSVNEDAARTLAEIEAARELKRAKDSQQQPTVRRVMLPRSMRTAVAARSTKKLSNTGVQNPAGHQQVSVPLHSVKATSPLMAEPSASTQPAEKREEVNLSRPPNDVVTVAATMDPQVVSHSPMELVETGQEEDVEPLSDEEYDPSVPNSYEAYCLEREREVKRVELRERLVKLERERAQQTAAKEHKINVEESADDAYARRLAMSRARQQPPKPVTSSISSVTSPATNEEASRVVLINNMVPPDTPQVDLDELEQEAKRECAKFGRVAKCVVQELAGVQVYVMFGSMSSAKKCVQDLDQTTFDGNTIRARFFNEMEFSKLAAERHA